MSNEYKDWMMDSILDYATKKHEGQYRKYTNEPYINHPCNVAKQISDTCLSISKNRYIDNDIISKLMCVAYLHDTVEDTDATYEEIEQKFGSYYKDMVYWLTNISTIDMGNRSYRKQIDMEHTLKAPLQAIIVKIADVIDNCRNIVENERSNSNFFDKNNCFSSVYLKEKNIFSDKIFDKFSYIMKKKESELDDYELIFKYMAIKMKSILIEKKKELEK